MEDEADKLTPSEAFAILNDRDKEDRAVRDSVFMGLADFYRNAKSFVAGEVYREIPAWLEVEAYQDELKRYFKGGIPELIEQAKCLRDGVETIERIIEQLSQKGKSDA